MSKPANHQLIHSSESAEWFTPPRYIQAVREVLGGIDLDPASSRAASRIVGGRRAISLRRITAMDASGTAGSS
jgi:hypothetical protein